MIGLVGYDSETFPIRPGRQAPRVVCGQFQRPGHPSEVLLRDDALEVLRDLLEAGATIVCHRAAYDTLVAAATRPDLWSTVLTAYREGRIKCTMVREKLARIAAGRGDGLEWSLLACLGRYKVSTLLTEEMKAPGSWRVRYGELDGISVDQWPEAALVYAQEDPRATLALYEAQAARWPAEYFIDEDRRARASFVLALTSAWGMRIDQDFRAELATKILADLDEHRAHLVSAGLVRPDGTKDTKAAKDAMTAAVADPGLSPKGKELWDRGRGVPKPELIADGYISLDKDACDTTHPVDCPDCAVDPDRCERYSLLERYAAYTSADKTRGRLERLRRAGDLPIQPRYDELKDTGRTSASSGDVKAGQQVLAWGDAIQNLDRAPGLRECYRARPGHWLISFDYSAGELHTLAQVCIWLGLDSTLARVLNSGKDVHTWFAAVTNNWDETWAGEALKGLHGPDAQAKVSKARQAAKAADFGFPGGLGWEKFLDYAWTQWRVRLTKEQAQDLKGKWLEAFPEMRGYFACVNALCESGEPQVFFRSERRRGGVYYTNAANGWFQGLLADCALDAGWRIVESGLRPWAFLHDEWIIEAREGAEAHRAATQLSECMLAAGRHWCPDVPLRGEPAAMIRWRKDCKTVYQDGLLVPHEWRDLDPKTVTRIKEASGQNPIRLSWRFGIEPERIREIQG